MKLQYHMKEPAVQSLGPGTRYVLWVQGCYKSCPGCIAPETHDPAGGKSIQAGALAWEIALSGADGLTISGGEPFLQAAALTELIREVHKLRPDMGVIVFTGYPYEFLLKPDRDGLVFEEVAEFLNEIDLLVDGEYISSLNDGVGLRGSSNQRLIPLTDVYLNELHDLENNPRRVEIFPHGCEIHYVGIPQATFASLNASAV